MNATNYLKMVSPDLKIRFVVKSFIILYDSYVRLMRYSLPVLILILSMACSVLHWPLALKNSLELTLTILFE